MDYIWYEQIRPALEIEQGDIIKKCPIPFFGSSVYEAISNEGEISEVADPILVKNADVIVLSQSCDIKNNKIDSIIVCPVWPLLRLIEKDSYYKSSKARNSLRQGKEPSYHLINKCSLEEQPLPYSVVEFYRIYSLPKEYLLAVINKQVSRLRLLPPYREHLSQAFARYFMRVGLPVDICEKEIKEIVP